MKDISVFRRGQVWYINDDIVRSGSIQCRSRPFLVVSNDICNTYSSVIHLAPITSKAKKYQPTHVHFINQYNEENVILLEQITIRSVPSIIKSAKYMFTLSPALMDKVDDAIAVQFGLKESIPSSSTDTDKTIDIIDLQTYNSVELEVAVTSEESNDEIDTSDTIKLPSQIDKFNARLKKHNDLVKSDNSDNKVKEVPITRTESGRVRWTPELKDYFLYESTFQSDEYMMEKYSLTLTTYKNRLYSIKREIKEKENSYE